jgi:hypothetical protein
MVGFWIGLAIIVILVILAFIRRIDKIPIVDSGDGHGMPSYGKGVTGSMVAISEGIKISTGLDIPEILGARKKFGVT